MSLHFNIQVSIQKVEKINLPGRAMTPPSTERQTTDVLKLTVTADTEREAFHKAVRILQANAPEPVGRAVPADALIERGLDGQVTIRPV